MNSAPIKIGIVGLGKIARDQHIPALRADSNFELVAVTSKSGAKLPNVPTYHQLSEMLEGVADIAAVSFCTPPQGRYALARQALEQGLHVMLEKPPGTTTAEIEDLAARTLEKGVTLFSSWHSRAAPAVQRARTWLANRTIHSVVIRWKENVRQWHPGQQWIWEPGGLGVFDPGINALSLITAILPQTLLVTEAQLSYPANRDMPIAAKLKLCDGAGMFIDAEFDFRQIGEQTWDIVVDTDAGRLRLAHGGATMQIDGRSITLDPGAEYPTLYRHFAQLVRSNRSDVDFTPLRLVADAFLLARREIVEPFYDEPPAIA
jgi:D-galactose 1-dehydrogenase